MTKTLGAAAPLFAALGLAACHTTPAPDSGLMASYEGLEARRGGMPDSASVRQVRDDAASDGVTSVFIAPAVFSPGAADRLNETEQAMILREVDRQICFEVSERFDLAAMASPQTASIRTAVVRVHPTGRVGSAVSAAAGFFVPLVNLRMPGATGGLAIESELLEAGTGRRIAALSWARNAQIIGRDSPSLSRIGDALQMAEPMGDAVGDAFSSEARQVRDIPEPDPCAAHGSRNNIGRDAAGFIAGFATGLYSPEISGAGSVSAPPRE